MDKNVTIAQMRGTIFLSETIGFTPDNANKFKALLLREAQVSGVVLMPGVPPAFVPAQWGAPWCLQYQDADMSNYWIMFLPGKIDIIRSCEQPYESTLATGFVHLCAEWINKITTSMGSSVKPTRVAYAPMFVLIQEECQEMATFFWNNILKVNTLDAYPIADRNVSYLLKKEISLNDKSIQLNLLHNISDGIQTRVVNSVQESRKVIMIQFDINTIPEINYNLENSEINTFFEEVLIVKEKLINNLLSL